MDTKQFYVELEEVKRWNVTVEAEDEDDALDKAERLDISTLGDPDSSYIEPIWAQEVKIRDGE